MATISASPVKGTEGGRRVPRFDGYLMLAMLLLILVGLMSLFSEGMTRDGGADFRKQVLLTLIGIVPFAIFFTVHPNVWRRMSAMVYGTNLLALLAVLAVGSTKKGAERWINLGPMQFQPSEMAKLLIILTLAAFYANRQDRIQNLSTFLLGFLHVAVPVALILKQPHLGASMVVMVTWVAVSLVAGVPLRYLVGFLALFGSLAAAVVTVPAVSDLVLRDYQKGRVQGMFKKDDAQGKNWQTDRAEIAFGVGGVVGTGFMKGEQKRGHFIPEQHNDFIFTVVGEEGGLIGAGLVLTIFGFFYYRVFLVMFHAIEPYYRMIAAGVFAALGFHTFVNIGMVLQILPVVGLWLPFLSYGGTAMWLCMACVGLLLNIRRREKPILF